MSDFDYLLGNYTKEQLSDYLKARGHVCTSLLIDDVWSLISTARRK